MEKTSLIFKIKSFFSKINKFELFLVAAILLLSAFLRLYKIEAYMTFLGDEGRDAIVVRRLLVFGDIILVGPGTSIGNMYLGPLYYYMMAPMLFLANYSPVGPAIGIAILGIITVGFVWWVAREWFGKVAGYVASFLYAISPTVIIYSRSSWNPNIMPFFSLAAIYLSWRVWQKKEIKWLPFIGICFAFVIQSHYMGLLILPVILMCLGFSFLKIKSKKFIISGLIGLILFLVLMSPLIIFDGRHGWRNASAIKKFFTARQETVSARPWKAFPQMWPRFVKINTRLVAGRNESVGVIVSIIFILTLLWLVLFKREKYNERKLSIFLVIFSWFFFALIGFGIYKQEIYDHYYGFLFVLPFLITALLLQRLKSSQKILFLAGFVFLVLVNWEQNPLKYPPNLQMARSQSIARVIAEKANGERFNLASISERNNRDVYQYFLELENASVVDTDPANTKMTITDQLFVVCEFEKKKCDPTHNPSAWIAGFGWTKIIDEWDVWGATLYKLGHTK